MSRCPARLELLAQVEAGESIPHLEECDDCREFLDAASAAVSAFRDVSEVEAAVRAEVDLLLAEVPLRRWTPSLLQDRNLRHSIVIRELLRRADEQYGSNPRQAVSLTATALAVSDAITTCGTAPSPDLRFDVLKTHSLLLRETGAYGEALAVLNRAMLVAQETTSPEVNRAIASLCAAILYAEPDVARFEEAIELTETAAAVLDLCADPRRAAIAQHTKAYALVVTNRHEAAIPILKTVIQQLATTSHSRRDAALAHALLALSLVTVGSAGEALDHARIAEHLHAECGDTLDAARAAHVGAMALAAMGHFADVRDDFTRTAELVFSAGLFDAWCLLRLDYLTAALAADPSADVRSDIEAVARVSMTVAINNSTQRRQFAAEALDYLRRLALRDIVTVEVVGHVRTFIRRNTEQRPVRYTPSPGAGFLM